MSEAPLFRLRGIGFAYDSDRPVLDAVDLDLHAGERLALVGPNGAGKTTLFHIMVGLLRPHAGIVEAFGRERREEKDFHEVRTRAGLLFQDPDDQLFSPTVAEDVAFGPLNLGKSRTEAQAIARETLAALNLEGLEERVTYKLSGGEKRLVSLATVLALKPRVLLLDEPTNALDAEAEERLIDILLGLPQAMIVISHDRAFRERLATRAALLKNGRLTPA